jgi:hypothetical protein
MKRLFLLVAMVLLNGCSLGDAARVLVNGLPHPTLPRDRTVTLTLFAGSELNTKAGETTSRPARMCVYVHSAEDWSPPLDLVAKCAPSGSKLEKVEEITLVANRVATVSARVPYLDSAWITVTGDFVPSGSVGNNLLKLKSPADMDTCHWAKVEKNVITEVSRVSPGTHPICK